MKRLIPLLLIVILLPQVAMATWWNPISWFNGWSFMRSDAEKKALEYRVKELEERLNRAEGSGSTTTQNTSKTKITTGEKNFTKSSSVDSIKPQIIPMTTIVNRDVLYADIMQKYMNFQSTISSEKGGLRQNSTLYTERYYFVYVEDLLKRISSDIGYLTSIKNYNPRPLNIEEIYINKFSKLKNEHDIKVEQYIVERKQDEAATERAKEEAAKAVLLGEQQYVQDIDVKIAEMDQLRIQIDTLAKPSLILFLNEAKKLDGSALFYTNMSVVLEGKSVLLTIPMKSIILVTAQILDLRFKQSLQIIELFW
jgi:hypothetical protein